MKSKFLFGLLAMMLVVALAPSSFAQVNVQIFSSPSAAEVSNNRTAQTADPLSNGAGVTVSGSVIANAELTTTALLLNFGAPITSSGTVPPLDPLRLTAATGLFSGAVISTIRFATGVIEITLPECKGGGTVPPTPGTCAATTPSGSFRLVGTRIDVNGRTAPLTVSGTLNNTANNYLLTTNSGTTILALSPGVASLAIGARPARTNLGTATILSNATSTDNTASVVITEGCASCWRTVAQASTVGNGAGTLSTPNAYQLRITLAGLTTGQTLSVQAFTGGATSVAFTNTGTDVSTFSTTALTRNINILGSDLTLAESIELDFTVTANGTAPLAPAAITVSVQMWPVGSPTTSGDPNGTPNVTSGYPIFADTNVVGPVTIVSVVPASTTLLVPFAVRDGAFDTGIALSNTTADPFGAATGGATAQSGTVVLDFYPRSATGGAGTTFSLTTSATARPGVGLSSDGSLAAGATWTVLLSELLTASGQTGSFTGYIFIRTNFLLAHGAPFVSDFRNFTSYTPMLVLPAPIGAARVGFEALNN